MTTVTHQNPLTTYDINRQIPTDQLSSTNVDKVVQSVTNATKRLSQISTNTNTSSKKRKSQNKIGPWKLGRTLGRGSTGRVRLAKNVETGQLAAVKIVPKSNFKKFENPKYKRGVLEDGDDEDAQRLPYGIEREIIIMKLMSHPNIMGLYDVWENKNDLYLILEYIEGGELFDYLIKKGKLQEFEAINYFKQIINGINYLHQFNICHRDLKPENLLLDFNKNIKIADFGMAALEVNEKLLETSCGSPHYASPEIVAGKNYHGAPSDIWSCGIILFALLTGHLPFDDENIRKLLLKVQNGKFIIPHDISWEAKDLITKMLKVNPFDRIEIESILTHPLLTKYPDPSISYASTTTLDVRNLNVKPIESVAKIDKEILKNLSVLFHNCDEKTIISSLLSPYKCPEKMFYYLLMKYRNEHVASLISNDTLELEATNTKKSLPRSTSIVHTIIFDDETGEAITTTTERKPITKSASIYSNKSLLKSRSSKNVLGNITNKQSQTTKQFKASNSFNKRKVSQPQIYKSQNTSSSSNSSLKSNKTQKQKVLNTPITPSGNSPIKSIGSKPEQRPPVLNEVQRKHDLSGKFGNKSIKNFEYICDEMFNEEPDKENKLPSRTASQRKREGVLARKERELAEQVHRKNEEREKKLKAAEEAKRRALEEEERRLNDARRLQFEQNEKELQLKKDLEEKQRIALTKLNKRQSTHDFEDLVDSNSNRRSITEQPPPIKSLLDPRSNPIIRARTMGAPSRSRNVMTSNINSPQINENTSKVLQKLGIDVAPSPKKFTKDFKTSSSKNLASFITPSPSGFKNLKTSSSRNLAGLLNNDTTIESSKQIGNNSTKLTPSESSSKNSINKRHSTQSSYYKSMLNDIDENKPQKTMKTASIPTLVPEDDELNNSSMSLIPNPRFSRFSFGGLLQSQTVANEEGDITIMIQTLNNSSTVVRRSNESTHSAFTSGLGIKVIDTTIKEDDAEENQDEPQNSSTSYKSKNRNFQLHKDVKYDDFEDDNSDATTVESEYSYISSNHLQIIQDHTNNNNPEKLLENELSNFDLISSRTADIGKVNKQKPSIVSSKETLIETSKDDLDRNTSKNGDTFVARVNDDFDDDDENYSSIDENSMIGEPVNEVNKDQNNIGNNFKRSRHSTGIFSTAQLPRSPHVQLPETTTVTNKKESRKSNLGNEHVITSPVQDQFDNAAPKETSLFRKLSLNPKRNAPKAPHISHPVLQTTQPQQPQSAQPNKGHNRFSRISVISKNLLDQPQQKLQDQPQPKKSNWFKKFFQSLSGTTNTNSSSIIKSDDEYSSKNNKDIKIISTTIKFKSLIKILKSQIELKKLDGSIINSNIDEEFGIITGIIPKKFSNSNKKLVFKIEIIDLINSSSLHLIKIKGNERGFINFVKIVEFVIRNEEENVV
ncbi:HSL1 [Candida pseudojiufengensis]|uniref:HSL1 n=1 Tax=Candida pseudojiufengensis TaxID=497109 RepID=UPI002224757E|nr:HSL1 [Candida pseudojiufengensis]KAI5964340.1 HSL1 [Candida pseudojiufengensis]